MQSLKQENLKLKKDNYMLKQQVQQIHKQLQDRTLNFWKRNQQPISKRYIYLQRTYSNIKITKIHSSHLQKQLQCKSKTIIQLTNTIQSLRQQLLQYEQKQKRKSIVRKQEINKLKNQNNDLVSHQECQQKFNQFIMVLEGKNNQIMRLTKLIKEMEGKGKQKKIIVNYKRDQEKRVGIGIKSKENKKEEDSKLREENESLQNIIKKLTEQINRVTTKNKMLQSDIINLEVDLQKQKQKNLTTDFKRKEKQFQEQYNKEMRIFTQKLQKKEIENQNLKQKINELVQKIKNNNQQMKKIERQSEKERKQMRKKIGRLQQQMNQKNETIMNMIKEKEELLKQRECEILNEGNKKHKSEQYLRRIGSQKEIQEKKKVNEQKKQQERIQMNQEKQRQIQGENELNKKIIMDLKQQINKQKRKNDQIKRKYDKIRKDNKELEKIKEIKKQKQLKQIEAQLISKRQAISNIIKDREERQKFIQETSQKDTKESELIEYLLKSIANFQNKNSTLQKKIEQRQAKNLEQKEKGQVEQKLSEQVYSLESQIEMKCKEMEKLKDDSIPIQQHKLKIHFLQGQLKNKQQSLMKITEEINDAEKKNSQQRQHLMKIISELEGELLSLKQSSQSKEQIESYNKTEKLMKRIEKLESQLKSKSQTISDMLKQRDERQRNPQEKTLKQQMELELSERKRLIEQLLKSNANLQEKNSTLQKRIEQSQAMIFQQKNKGQIEQNLHAHLNSLKSQIEIMSKEMEKLKVDSIPIQQHKSKIHFLQGQLKNKQQSLMKITEEINDAEKKNSQQRQHLMKIISELEGELLSLKQQSQSKEQIESYNKNEKLMKRIKKLEQQLKYKSQTISDMLKQRDERQRNPQEKTLKQQMELELSERKRFIEQLLKSNANLQDKNSTLQKRIEQSQAMIFQQKNKGQIEQNLHAQVNSLESQIEIMSKEMEKLKVDSIPIQQHKSKIHFLQGQLKNKQQSLMKITEEINDAEKKNSQQRQHLMKIISELEGELLSLKQSSQSKEQIESYNKTEKLMKRIEKLESQLKSKSQTISDMLKQRDERQRNPQEKTLKQQMELELSERKRLIEQLLKSNANLQDKNSTLQKRIEQSQAMILQQKNKGQVEQNLHAQVNSLESQIEIMSKEMEKLKVDSIPIQQHKSKIHFLQGQLKNKQQSLMKITEEINDAEKKNSQQRQHLMKIISELEGELLSLKQSSQSKEQIESYNKTEKLMKRIEKLESQLKSKSQTISDMLKQRDERQRNPQENTLKQQMELELSERKRFIEQLLKSNANLQDKNSTLQKRIEQSQAMIFQQKNKGQVEQNLHAQVNSLESQIEIMSKEMEKLKVDSIQIQQHKSKIHFLQGQLKNKQQSLMKITEEINDAEKKNSQQKQHLMKIISELEGELLSLKQSSQSKEQIESYNKTEKLIKRIEKLESQLKSKSQTISDMLKQRDERQRNPQEKTLKQQMELELSERKRFIEQLLKSNANLQDKNSTLQKRIEQSQAMIFQQKNKGQIEQNPHAQVNSLNSQIEIMSKEMEKLKFDSIPIQQHKSKIHFLQGQLKNKQQSLMKITEEINDAEKKNSQQRQHLMKIISELEGELLSLKQSSQSKEQIESYNKTEKLMKRIEKLQSQLKSKSQTISDMLKQRDERQRNPQEKTLKQQMELELSERKRFIEQLLKSNANLQDKNSTLQKRIEQSQAMIFQQKNKGQVEQNLHAQVNSFESQIEIMSKEMEKLKVDSIPIQQHKSKIHFLQGQLKNKQQSLMKITEEINDAEQKNSQQRQHLMKIISELEGELLSLKQSSQSKEQIESYNKTEKLIKRIEKLESQLKSKSQTISDMLKQRDERQRNPQEKTLKQQMELELSERKRFIEQLLKSNANLQDKNSTLQKRIEQSQAMIFQQKNKGQVEQNLHAQVNSLESQIEIMSKEMEKLKVDSIPIQQHKSKIHFLQGQLKNKQQSLMKITEEINDSEKKNSQQTKQLMNRISELEGELLSLKQSCQSKEPINRSSCYSQTDRLKKWIDKLQYQLRSKSQTIEQLLKQRYDNKIDQYQSPINSVFQQSQVNEFRCQIQSLQQSLQKQRQINQSLLSQIGSLRQKKSVNVQSINPELIQKQKQLFISNKNNSQLKQFIDQIIKQNEFYKQHSKFTYNPNIQLKEQSLLQSKVHEYSFLKNKNVLKPQTSPFQQQANTKIQQSKFFNFQELNSANKSAQQSNTIDPFQQFLISRPQIQSKIKTIYKHTKQLTLIKLCQMALDFHKSNAILIEQNQSLKAKELEIEMKNFEDEYFREQVSKQREQLKNQIAYLSKTLQAKNSQLNIINIKLNDSQKKAEKAIKKEKEYEEYKSMYQNLLNQNMQVKYKLQNKKFDSQKKANYQRIIEQLQIENEHLNQIIQENKHGSKGNSCQVDQVRYQLKSIKNQQSRLKQSTSKFLNNLRAQINQYYQQLWQEKRKLTQNMLDNQSLLNNIVDLIKCDKQSILEAVRQKMQQIQKLEKKIDAETLTLRFFQQEVKKKDQEIIKQRDKLEKANQRLVQQEQQFEKEQYQSKIQKQKEKLVELQECNKQILRQNQVNKKIISEKDQLIKEKVEQFKSKESLFIAKEQQNQNLKKQIQNMKQIIKEINQNKKKMKQQLQDRQSQLYLKNMELETLKQKSDKCPQKWKHYQEELVKLRNQIQLQNHTIQILQHQYDNQRKNYHLLEAKTKEVRKVINQEVLKEISEEDKIFLNQSQQSVCCKELEDLKRIKKYIRYKNQGFKRLESSKSDQIDKNHNKQNDSKKVEYQKIINGLKERIISLEFSIKMLSIKEIDEKDLKQFIKKIQGYQEQKEKQMFKQTIINFIKKLVEKQKNLTNKLDKVKTELVQKQIQVCQIQTEIKTLKNEIELKKIECQKKDQTIQLLTKQVQQYDFSLNQLIQILKQKSDLLNEFQKKFRQNNILDKEYQFQKKINQLQRKSGQIIFRQQSLRQSNNEQRSRIQKTYSFYSIQKNISYYQQLIQKLKNVLKKINRQNFSEEIEEINNLLNSNEEKQKLQIGWNESRELKQEHKQLLLKKQFERISEQDKQKQFDISFSNEFLRNQLLQKQKAIRNLTSQIETCRQELQSLKKRKQQENSYFKLKNKQMQNEIKYQQKKVQFKSNTLEQDDIQQVISETCQGNNLKNRKITRINTYQNDLDQQQQSSFEINKSKISYVTAEPDKKAILKRKSRKEYKQVQQRQIQLLKKEIRRLNHKVESMRQLQKQCEVLRYSKNKLQQEMKELRPEYKIILEKLHQSEYSSIVEEVLILLKKNQIIPKNFVLNCDQEQSSFEQNTQNCIGKFNQEKLISIQYLIDRIIAMENISARNYSQDQLIKVNQKLKKKLQRQKKKNKELQLELERKQKLKKFPLQIKQVNQQNYDQIISEMKMKLEIMTEKLDKKEMEFKSIIVEKDKLQVLIEQMQNDRDLKQQKIADLQRNNNQLKSRLTKPILLHHGRK